MKYLIVIVLGIIAIVFFISSVYLTNSLRSSFSNLLLNLSASLVILIIATFLIEPILEGIKKREWIGIRNKSAIEDFKLFSNLTASYLLAPLGYIVTNYVDINKPISDSESSRALEKMLEDATKEKLNLGLKELSKDKWINLINNLFFLRNEIKEIIDVYQHIMPKDLLSELLTLRVNFRKIDRDLALFNTIFLFKEDDWVQRSTIRKVLFNQLCEGLSKKLFDYLQSVQAFRKLLSESSKRMKI